MPVTKDSYSAILLVNGKLNLYAFGIVLPYGVMNRILGPYSSCVYEPSKYNCHVLWQPLGYQHQETQSVMDGLLEVVPLLYGQ